MSKLVVGSAQNKLFMRTPTVEREEDLLKLCAGIARRCSGRSTSRLLRIRTSGDGTPMEPELYEWLEGYWVRIERP